ncbi:hypothetical protein OG497_37415 [Streptomyces sp. NBC_01242]|uniref:hypothetical protein n=1 Tax=Streptomyces sp. NBC_01242 TaxID=2903795 RepID=UPI002253328F|nr:hypothetical protein [Streptomyces sp. NBC_01242]MCX4799538.1 hypothetical protein [Streptomyces sp. NBC_01242]
MPLTSVPGQVSTGMIDALFRDDAGDGTLGLPDFSPIPYTYAPLLGIANGSPQWVLDQFRKGSYAALKGSPDGLGALRSTGADNGAFGVEFICQATGSRPVNPTGARAPGFTWGPRDFALAVRHSGATAANSTRAWAYVAFDGDKKTVGMRISVANNQLGPWDAELADSAPVQLGGSLPDPWDGNAHTALVASFGSNVLCIIDNKVAIPFRAPRAYKRRADGTTDTAVFSALPSTGAYGGYDNRSEQNYLYSWKALQGASGDFFFYDMGLTVVQPAPSTTYTPTVLASGEAWTLTGTATASKTGLQLAASSSAVFNSAVPYGLICTRWGACQAQAGLQFRRQDASNYYILTSTGTTRYTAGVPAVNATFATPIQDGDHVVVHNYPTTYAVYVNGVQYASFSSLVQGHGATGIGFFNPAGGTGQWRYIAFQPHFTDPVLPTA